MPQDYKSLRNKMSTHFLGKSPSPADVCVVGLCRPPAVDTTLSWHTPTQQKFLSSPSCSITAPLHFSPSGSRAGGEVWGGNEAKVSPYSKVTSVSQLCLVSDPKHCFRSQKAHQSVFWSSAVKASMQPKTSPCRSWFG